MHFYNQITAACAEAGEIIQSIATHVINKDSLIEIGNLLIHPQPELKQQLTVFKSVGLAIQDISVAEMVYTNAMKNKTGHSFQLS